MNGFKRWSGLIKLTGKFRNLCNLSRDAQHRPSCVANRLSHELSINCSPIFVYNLWYCIKYYYMKSSVKRLKTVYHKVFFFRFKTGWGSNRKVSCINTRRIFKDVTFDKTVVTRKFSEKKNYEHGFSRKTCLLLSLLK